MDFAASENLRRQLEEHVGEYVPGPAVARAPAQNGKRTRSIEVLHNFCLEPLPWYKKLEHTRPQWPADMRKFTSQHGFRVADTHTIEVSARDKLQRTKCGLLRISSGLVTYSAVHRFQLEIDAEELVRIFREKEPHAQHGKMWRLSQLEKAFRSQMGRQGSWNKYNVPFKVYLSLFPKTFDLLGDDYIRLANKTRQCAVDSSEDAMISLALACEKGFVERIEPLAGSVRAGQESQKLPQLRSVRARTVFKSTSDPGLRSKTLPAPSRRGNNDISMELPPVRANTHSFGAPQKTPSAVTQISPASTFRVSEMDEARSTFRVSFADGF